MEEIRAYKRAPKGAVEKSYQYLAKALDEHILREQKERFQRQREEEMRRLIAKPHAAPAKAKDKGGPKAAAKGSGLEAKAKANAKAKADAKPPPPTSSQLAPSKRGRSRSKKPHQESAHPKAASADSKPPQKA